MCSDAPGAVTLLLHFPGDPLRALAYCPPAELFDDTADFLLQHTHFVRSAQRREGAVKKASPGRVRH